MAKDDSSPTCSWHLLAAQAKWFSQLGARTQASSVASPAAQALSVGDDGDPHMSPRFLVPFAARDWLAGGIH